MQCPVCKVELLLSVREDVEIDCCPKCGGIWLDGGELLRIVIGRLTSERMERSRKRPRVRSSFDQLNGF